MSFRHWGLLASWLPLAILIVACSSPAPVLEPVVTATDLPTLVPSTLPPATIAPARPTATLVVPPAPTINTTIEPTAEPKRVGFRTGQFNATVQGTLKKNGTDQWALGIMGGQTLSVTLIPANGKAKLSVVGARGAILIPDRANVMQWSGKVNDTQDYTITVIAYDDTAPSYSLQITLPPVPPATIPPTAAPIVKRIVFSQNSTSAILHNVLPKNGSDQWALRVVAGQTMNVNVATENGKARLIIWGADGTVLVSDHANASSWVGRVPATQDYNIKVNAYDNTAPGYTLSITIPLH